MILPRLPLDTRVLYLEQGLRRLQPELIRDGLPGTKDGYRPVGERLGHSKR